MPRDMTPETIMDLPEPFLPAEVDLRDWDSFSLNVERLLSSELWALSSGDEFKAAVALWCRAWKQVPAASLPNDDRVLAAFSGAGSRWKKVREAALRGFVLCSDGRLYHRVLAEDALRSWERKLQYRDNRQADRERLRDWRDARRRKNNENRTPETPAETPIETPVETPKAPDETADETRFNDVSKRVGNGDETSITVQDCKSNKTILPLQSPSFHEIDRQFDRFWKAYPSRGGFSNPKQTAQAKFHKLVKKGDDPEAIIAGAERYAKHCREQNITGGKLVAQAVTFLNQARWQDADPPPKALREAIEQEYGRAWL